MAFEMWIPRRAVISKCEPRIILYCSRLNSYLYIPADLIPESDGGHFFVVSLHIFVDVDTKRLGLLFTTDGLFRAYKIRGVQGYRVSFPEILPAFNLHASSIMNDVLPFEIDPATGMIIVDFSEVVLG